MNIQEIALLSEVKGYLSSGLNRAPFIEHRELLNRIINEGITSYNKSVTDTILSAAGEQHSQEQQTSESFLTFKHKTTGEEIEVDSAYEALHFLMTKKEPTEWIANETNRMA